eukprot:GHVR01008519.1.p1 GENE.GHVR01008519.1~~GHVR01008519.1.p1  ORF type:complete len:159 (-),score=35.10 GHVR01008519.1:126-602(-)
MIRSTLLGLRVPIVQRVIPPLLVRCYSEELLEHFNNPKNVGTFDKNATNIGSARSGSAACGDEVQIQLKINEHTGIIEDAKMKAFGCGSAIASISLATEMVKGIHYTDALKIKNSDVARHLKLPKVKYHCSVLVEEALTKALQDWKEKNLIVAEKLAL